MQCIEQCIEHPPEPRSGLCPELLADFRIPKPPGCSQGAQRAVFCAVRVADFLAEGAGWGAPQGVAASWGANSETSWVLARAKRRRETQPEDDDGASRLVGMPERESLGPKLVRSRFRSRSCGDSPEPVKANPAAGLQGAAAPRGECWQRGRRLDGRRRHSLLE